MSWNEPERNDKGKDPWGRKDKGPPDLDEAFRQFQNKLRGLFGGNQGTGTPLTKTQKSVPGKLGMLLIAGAIFVIYILSGIYIVDPPEKAVVTRFGRYIKTVGPGPHWAAPLIEGRKIVDVEKIHSESQSGYMITKDKNIALAEIAIQYRIDNPEDYLFNLTDPLNTLSLATRSALRSGVGKATLDEILTEGRTTASLFIRDQIQTLLNNYGAGIKITRANLRKTTVPEGEVQEAYDDANAASQDQEKFINQAYAEKVKVINIAEGDAKAIVNEAEAYKESKILEATGNAKRFQEMLPEYRLAPTLTQERLYIETMQQVYSQTGKVLIDVDQGNNLVYIPLDKIGKARMAHSEKPLEYKPPESRYESAPSSTYESYQKPTGRITRPSYSNSSRPAKGASS